MSKYSNCALYVDGNGRYCKREKFFIVGDHPVVVTNANCDPVELLLYPTGDTDEVSIPSGIVAGPGTTVVSLPGKYELPCPEGLDGTDAPEDVTLQKTLCCCEIRTSLDPLMLQKLCEIAAASGDDTALIAIVEKLCALLEGPDGSAIEKLCAIADSLGPDSTIVEKLCEIALALVDEDGPLISKLCDILASNESWCEADATFQAAALLCFEQLKANTAAITGIETSLGQIGCTEDAEGNITGSVLVCKVSDTTTDPVTDTIKVWWFGLDGTTIENYEGPYVACTNLQALANILEDILDKLKSVKRPFNVECVQKFTRCVGYDNGHTPGSSVNDGGLRSNFVSFPWTFAVKGWMVNGEEVGAGDALGPFTGWTPQLQGWADYFNANMPAGSKCNAAFGFIAAPTYRYTKITCNDPTTTFGPLRLERDDGVCYTIYPLFAETTVELAYRYNTLDCDGVKETVWCDAMGNPVDAPVDPECWYSCDVEAVDIIAGPPGPDCTTPTSRKLCQDVGGVRTEFYAMEYYCDGALQVELYTADSWAAGNLEEFVLDPKGSIVDCLTGEAVELPCDPAIQWEIMNGYICDPEDSRFGEEVCWVQGIDCGKIVFPNGKSCPEFYPGKIDTTEASGGGTCTALSLGSAATGLVEDGMGAGGTGTDTHTIKIGQAGSGAGLANQIVNSGGTFDICKITIEGKVVFTYDATNVEVTGGTVGTGSISFSSDRRTDLDPLCQAAYDAIWNEQEAAVDGNFTGYARNCTQLTPVVDGDPIAAACDAPLEIQPKMVSKTPPEKGTWTTTCVESQEWTYGLDNTGTIFSDVATYCMDLSDGTTVEWAQDGTATGYTMQVRDQWAPNLQAAADTANLVWFVEPRVVNNPLPDIIDGTYNGANVDMLGAPSVALQKKLIKGGMVARYLNIQTCPGQPTPVRAYRKTSTTYGDGVTDLTTAGACLGELRRFERCVNCLTGQVLWFKEVDGALVELEAGEVPKCWEPCGTLSLAPAPAEKECDYKIETQCDSNNSDIQAEFISDITRRALVCAGQEISVDYFMPDPNDPTSLQPYTLVGTFVDCDTGEPTPLPPVECGDFEIITMYAMTGKSAGLRSRDWESPDNTPLPQGDVGAARDLVANFDYTIAPTVDAIVTVNAAALNDANNSATVLDFQIREGYICVAEPFEMRYRTSAEGSVFLELGKCCGPLEELIAHSQSVNGDPSPSTVIPAGIHKIRLITVDNGRSNSSWTAQTKAADGITWVNNNRVLDDLVSTALPVERTKKIQVCKPSGLFVDLLTGKSIDKADCYCEPLACEACCGSATPQMLRIVE